VFGGVVVWFRLKRKMDVPAAERGEQIYTHGKSRHHRDGNCGNMEGLPRDLIER